MFVERRIICDALRMSEWSSRQPRFNLRPRRMGLCDTADAVALLNRCARAGMPQVDSVSSGDVLTAEEIESRTGIPARRILMATKWRKRKPVPHWRITTKIVRFNLEQTRRWMDKEGE